MRLAADALSDSQRSSLRPLRVGHVGAEGTRSCSIVSLSDERADRDEALVVRVQELGQVIYSVLVEALQAGDGALEVARCDELALRFVEVHDGLLEAHIIHFHLLCLHPDVC